MREGFFVPCESPCGIAEALTGHPAYPAEEIARLVIVPGKIASIVLR